MPCGKLLPLSVLPSKVHICVAPLRRPACGSSSTSCSFQPRGLAAAVVAMHADPTCRSVRAGGLFAHRDDDGGCKQRFRQGHPFPVISAQGAATPDDASMQHSPASDSSLCYSVCCVDTCAIKFKARRAHGRHGAQSWQGRAAGEWGEREGGGAGGWGKGWHGDIAHKGMHWWGKGSQQGRRKSASDSPQKAKSTAVAASGCVPGQAWHRPARRRQQACSRTGAASVVCAVSVVALAALVKHGLGGCERGGGGGGGASVRQRQEASPTPAWCPPEPAAPLAPLPFFPPLLPLSLRPCKPTAPPSARHSGAAWSPAVLARDAPHAAGAATGRQRNMLPCAPTCPSSADRSCMV